MSLNLGTIFTFIPIVVIIGTFIYIKTKKNNELKEENRFGRRGKKDHIWQIIKEYHKIQNIKGSVIVDFFIFDRPKPDDLYDFLKKGYIYRAKIEAKEKKTRYRKPIIPKRFVEQDYFDNLTIETEKIHKDIHKSNKVAELSKSNRKKPYTRKRYVIVYKTLEKDILSNWFAIEVELIKKSDSTGKIIDRVVINKELDFSIELSWLQPLLDEEISKKLKSKKKQK